MTTQQPGQPGQQDGLTDVGDLFFQFTSPGDMLVGNYLGSLPIVWPDGNPGKQHFMQTADGVYKFTGSFNLDNALAMTAEGSYTEITYKGDQPTRRGLNPVRIFGVRTAQTKALPIPQPALPGMAPAQPLQIGQGRPQQYYVGGMPATEARPPYPRKPCLLYTSPSPRDS